MTQFSSLFEPNSVAIVGISRRPTSLGKLILHNIEQTSYSGEIYLVNPKASTIAGYQVYSSVSDIPNSIDVAVLVVPPQLLTSIFRECSQKNCKFVIVITGGLDGDSEEDQSEKLLDLGKELEISILGPNTMGMFSPSIHLSFSPIPTKSGSIGYLSQSGSIIVVAQEWMNPYDLGFSYFLSLGNKLDISELEVIDFLGNNEETKVIAGYLESFTHPRQFCNNVRKITPNKPVILSKGGRTDEGSKAVMSHTGALAGNYRLTKRILTHHGVIMVNTIKEQIELCEYFKNCQSKSITGIVTISSAGGPGVLAADEIVEKDLPLAKLEVSTINALTDIIPTHGNPNNPVDLVADAGIDRYLNTISVLEADPSVSHLLIIIVHPVLVDANELFKELSKLTTDLELICSYMGPDYEKYTNSTDLLIFPDTQSVVNILSNVNSYANWRQSFTQIFDHSHLQEQQSSFNKNVHKLLQQYGFSYPDTKITTSLNEALDWADFHDSIVMKLDHPKFTHKTEVGGIKLDIRTSIQLKEAWDQLQQIYIEHNIPYDQRKIELQPYYVVGTELVLGIIHDQQFGHFLLLGGGGTLVELRDDTIFIPSPTSEYSVKEFLKSLDVYEVLKGYRGNKAVDLDQLIKLVLQLDQLIQDHPRITELDINPLLALPNEFVVLDARMSTTS